MHSKTALVIGATGLIGSHLLEELQRDSSWGRVRVLARRPMETSHPGTEVLVTDFSQEDSFRAGMVGADAVFCAVGTTRSKVKGDLDAYRKIDYEIPVNAARFAMAGGCGCFALVSSVGANAGSSNFYLRLKGETEEAIQEMKYPGFLIFRPSLLLGKRGELRPAEWLAQKMMPLISFLLPGRLRPIQAKQVAKAMVASANNELAGTRIFHYREIRKLAETN